MRTGFDIAYFSLEIGLESSIPTYSGGLGVLAGDTIKAAADIGLPMLAVTLLYREGYFQQELDPQGNQTEQPARWNPESMFTLMTPRITVPIDGRDVVVRAFRQNVVGVNGHVVPVYYLDTDFDENDEAARRIAYRLYAGDTDHRIRQECLLGIGGRRIIRAIGHDVGCFHMNEGHACFLTVDLLSEFLCKHQIHQIRYDALADVRARCVFTTHTPIPAGHDRFAIERVRAIVGDHPVFHREDLYGESHVLNTTKLALNLSKFANGVARRHGQVSRDMFPGYQIESITNGIHASTWACQPMRDLFDQYVPEWRRRNDELRLVRRVPSDKLWNAHMQAKQELNAYITQHTDTQLQLDPDVFTIVFARRATEYKRMGLLLSDPRRLQRIAETVGPIQIVYAGKAHPHDGVGRDILRQVHETLRHLEGKVRGVFLPNYNIDLARRLVAGCDVWLNNPRPPLEASGTSGMKAAINGIPSLSTIDGWWIEGWVEGVTGWGIGSPDDDIRVQKPESMDQRHADELYDKLEHHVLPRFYNDRQAWINMMYSCIELNGSYFTTERMVREYAQRAYAL
ncbi:MAG: alpha-glucan family phosphorylase [Phycisphaerales bacterium]